MELSGKIGKERNGLYNSAYTVVWMMLSASFGGLIVVVNSSINKSEVLGVGCIS